MIMMAVSWTVSISEMRAASFTKLNLGRQTAHRASLVF